jgi:hypothetical protein
MGALVANGGDHRLGSAVDGPRLIAKPLDFLDNLLNLFRGSVGPNNDDHVMGESCKLRETKGKLRTAARKHPLKRKP